MRKPAACALASLLILSAGAVLPRAAGAAAKTKAKTKAKKATAKKPARRYAPRPEPVSPAMRLQAVSEVNEQMEHAAELPVENAAALVPFFEILYRQQHSGGKGPVSILQYGDSHTAADEWTGYMRSLFQMKFGDGGAGYSLAGRPFNSYRRLDLRSGGTAGWYTLGLPNRETDGLYGLGGVSISASRPNESIYLMAECERLELYYLKQPGGGNIDLYDNGEKVERISTAGETGPGYYTRTVSPGYHRFDVKTVNRAPVRLFGWVTENSRGVTLETLGINGAQASVAFKWDEALTAEHIGRRNPALIVLAYGTNDAGNPDWTPESYRGMFSALLQRLRKAAPAASILVVGPPDRAYRAQGQWKPYQNVDMIVEAQREAALGNGCAFWDLRAKMGGKGSMRRWVVAGMAQGDYVHFTGPGYRLIGQAVYQDVISQFEAFVKVRDQLVGQQTNGHPTSEDH